MRVAMYAPSLHAGCRALADGLVAALGASVTWERASTFLTPGFHDLVIVHGQRGPCALVAQGYRWAGIPVLITDRPRWRAIPDHLGVFPGSLNGLPDHGVPGRRTTLAPDAIQPMRTGDHILVVGQKPDDAAHGLDAEGLARSLESLTQRARVIYGAVSIRYRPHPKAHEPVPFSLPCVRETPTEPIDFTGAAVVVTHNSTAGLEAVMAGVPVLCDHSAYYHAWRNGEGREELLDRVLATQWSLDDLRDGSAVSEMASWHPAPMEA